jgi:DNA polymerase-3 subunit epsilon
MIVIEKWCYLGSASNHEELYDLTKSGKLEFDLDIYKIVKKAIAGSHKFNVVKLFGGAVEFEPVSAVISHAKS